LGTSCGLKRLKENEKLAAANLIVLAQIIKLNISHSEPNPKVGWINKKW
jgi:hypothetical protein